MKLTKPIVWFDLETTGTEVSTDRIVSIAMLKVNPDGSKETPLHFRVNPTIPIPKEASDVHGITDDMVKDCPVFRDVAGHVYEYIVGCDVGGFNVRNFDVPLLWEELARCKIKLDLSDTNIIDALEIYRKKEPRDLTAALKFFCGETRVDAHDALADIEATVKVLDGQRKMYSDIGQMDANEVAKFCKGDDRRLDLAGKITMDEDGDACFQIGNPRGRKVKNDLGFARWMLTKDFTQNTKQVVNKVLNDLSGQRQML